MKIEDDSLLHDITSSPQQQVGQLIMYYTPKKVLPFQDSPYRFHAITLHVFVSIVFFMNNKEKAYGKCVKENASFVTS